MTPEMKVILYTISDITQNVLKELEKNKEIDIGVQTDEDRELLTDTIIIQNVKEIIDGSIVR